jgi:hypothetical protein
LSATFSVTSGAYQSASANVVCDGTNVVGTSSVAGGIATFTPSAVLPYSTSCFFAGIATAVGVGTGKPASVDWNIAFQTEARPVRHYDSVTVAIVSGYPTIVTLASPPVKAINMTSYTVGGIPIYNCLVSEVPLATGEFLELCQMTTDGGNFHVISHDVVANVITNFTGTLPVGLEFSQGQNGLWTFGPKWHACMLADCQTGAWGTPPKSYMFAWAPAKEGGYHYADGIDFRKLMYEDAAGVDTLKWFDVNTTAIIVMVTISN